MGNADSFQEIQQRALMYLDNALSKEDEKEFLSNVNNDPVYHQVFSKEKYFKEFIKNNVRRPCVTPDLVQAIKDKIRIV